MQPSVLVTKLYAPVSKKLSILRLRLLERVEASVKRRLTLISASAGSGKSTLLAEWILWSGREVAWLTLDEELQDPSRFLTYVICSLQTLVPGIGSGILEGLASPFPPGIEGALRALINELVEVPVPVVFVLDDYHRLDSPAADQFITMLVENMPPRMNLMIGTREDPALPLSRWRANDYLTELRVADLRFTLEEAVEYFRESGLNLSTTLVGELQGRTEGWAAGLQMAALSLAGSDDHSGFIRSFAGNHRFILDYLIEEVLKSQPPVVQEFLLTTSVLDRFCGPLCDFVLDREGGSERLAALDLANLFIISLDDERKWYRYHQLFSDMLRQRLDLSKSRTPILARASRWFASQGLGPEAFRHAAAAQDIDQAEAVITRGLIPSSDRGTVAEILKWLNQLSPQQLKDRPLLLVRRATMLLASGQTSRVEEALAVAEMAFEGVEIDGKDDLLGQIAALRSTVAVTRYRPQVILDQASLALSLLREDNLSFRFRAQGGLGFAHLLLGNRGEASLAYRRALELGRRSGDRFAESVATTSMGQVLALENDLVEAARYFESVLQLMGTHPQPYACEASLGLAQIFYQWNDLGRAESLGRQALELGRQFDPAIDRFVLCDLFLVKLCLARDDLAAAATQLALTARAVEDRGFVHRLPEVAALQIEVLLLQGDVSAASALADQQQLVVGQIRVGLARGEAAEALPAVVALREQKKSKSLADEYLAALVLEALVQHRAGDHDAALRTLDRSLALAEPSGFIRLYLDEGVPMYQLLAQAAKSGPRAPYAGRLRDLFVFSAASTSLVLAPQTVLSPRETEVLTLIAAGLSNEAIGEKLFLALDTVKGHNRHIFEKLQVNRRTEAVAKGRELGLL